MSGQQRLHIVILVLVLVLVSSWRVELLTEQGEGANVKKIKMFAAEGARLGSCELHTHLQI
jgi:galactose-1-phosphate uridylyltransferase